MTRLETAELAAAVALVGMGMLAGCDQPRTPDRTPAPPDGRADLTTAADLIRAHISTRPSLVELTTDDVFERMGLQVFLHTDDFTSYVIKQGNVVELCEGLGGYGLQSMCVADVDDNLNLELVFTYSWGSGVHRSHVGVCYEDGSSLRTAIAPFWYYGDLFVKRADDQHVDIVVGDHPRHLGDFEAGFGDFTHIADFGEVKIVDQDGTISCRVEESDTLPDELRELIDRGGE